jgi:putative membrane protein
MTHANRRDGFLPRSAALLAVVLFSAGIAAAQDRPSAAGPGHTAADQQKQLRANRGNPNADKDNADIGTADRTMMRRMAQAHYGEIQLAALAQEISTDTKVRNFAQTLLDDHYKALGDLRKLADAKGVVLPGGANTDAAGAVSKLAQLNGKAFDQQFIASAGSAAQDQAVKLYKDAEGQVRDRDLKAYVAKYMPVLAQHLQSARQLEGGNQQAAAAGK